MAFLLSLCVNPKFLAQLDCSFRTNKAFAGSFCWLTVTEFSGGCFCASSNSIGFMEVAVNIPL